jgi:metal transporter CNNM
MNTLVVIIAVTLLVGMSAICSGLNVAIMSLDVAELKRKAILGDERAKRVLPLRINSHLTLASILLSNVAVISATSLVLESQFNGLIAGIASTLLIVVFGEVVPQAYFARFALTVCALLSPLLRLMILITYPISKPLQLLLDRLFGHEKSRLHTRSELGIIIGEHVNHNDSDLDEDEIEIIKGALLLSNKRVRESMTPLQHVYWLTPDTLIDAERIDEIKENGWSRIPIFNHALTECSGVLLMKDLVDMDFDDEPRLVRDLPLRRVKIVGSMTALDTLFKKFISARVHLMPVERDDHIVGIITIEDLLEEILGHEIEDETDS